MSDDKNDKDNEYDSGIISDRKFKICVALNKEKDVASLSSPVPMRTMI